MFITGLLAWIDVLSPVILHRPHHHCPVEVWTETLDGLVMFSLLFLGSSLPLGALVLSWCGSSGAARAAASRVVSESLLLASCAASGAMVMFFTHLAVARLMA